MNGAPAPDSLGTAMVEVVRGNLVRDPVLVCSGPGCDREITRRPGTEHKRFCTDGCRNAFHARRRRAGLAALAKLETERRNGLDGNT